jgi:TetR/AcrR family transcriptional regulator of autoinduction and epiphytic fitness
MIYPNRQEVKRLGMAKTKPKRKYNSSRRREQARQTRRSILEASRSLFFEKGYAGTSLEAIAQEAGVAVETVYANFGSKRAILASLVDFSVVGDEEPLPLLERPQILATLQETDPLRLITAFVHDIYEIMSRMSPIFALLRATAKSEPEIGSMLESLLKERLQGMAFFVNQVANIGPLRENLSAEQAAETVWTLSSGEVFQLLIEDLGWTREQYETWLWDALTRLLLP